jgi:hypothetical protein
MVVKQLVGDRHRLSSRCAAGPLGLGGTRRLKGPSRPPGSVSAPGERGPVDSRRSSRAHNQARGRGPAARTPSPPGCSLISPRSTPYGAQTPSGSSSVLPTQATGRSRRCTWLADPGRGGSDRRMDPAAPGRAPGADDAGVVLDKDPRDLLQAATARRPTTSQRHSVRTVETHRSALAFALSAWIGASSTSAPSEPTASAKLRPSSGWPSFRVLWSGVATGAASARVGRWAGAGAPRSASRPARSAERSPPPSRRRWPPARRRRPARPAPRQRPQCR